MWCGLAFHHKYLETILTLKWLKSQENDQCPIVLQNVFHLYLVNKLYRFWILVCKVWHKELVAHTESPGTRLGRITFLMLNDCSWLWDIITISLWSFLVLLFNVGYTVRHILPFQGSRACCHYKDLIWYNHLLWTNLEEIVIWRRLHASQFVHLSWLRLWLNLNRFQSVKS